MTADDMRAAALTAMQDQIVTHITKTFDEFDDTTKHVIALSFVTLALQVSEEETVDVIASAAASLGLGRTEERAKAEQVFMDAFNIILPMVDAVQQAAAKGLW